MKTFKTCFPVRVHEQNTRNNGFMLEVLKVKLQVAKSSFRSMGDKIYSDLPIQGRQTNSLLVFRGQIKKHFNI